MCTQLRRRRRDPTHTRHIERLGPSFAHAGANGVPRPGEGRLMDALRPSGIRIPRAFKNHKTPDGRIYRRYLVSLIARLGSLPPYAEPTLKEAGRSSTWPRNSKRQNSGSDDVTSPAAGNTSSCCASSCHGWKPSLKRWRRRRVRVRTWKRFERPSRTRTGNDHPPWPFKSPDPSDACGTSPKRYQGRRDFDVGPVSRWQTRRCLAPSSTRSRTERIAEAQGPQCQCA
jgi:hypothetical protein